MMQQTDDRSIWLVLVSKTPTAGVDGSFELFYQVLALACNTSHRHSVLDLERSKAPFLQKRGEGIDAQICRRLLAIALESGGDYADLFFEYRLSGSYVLEEGITRSASRGAVLGLGVRSCVGDATGYAHTQDLCWESMARAARTAGRIARAGGSAVVHEVEPRILPCRYDIAPWSVDVSGISKRALLERANQTAFSHDPRVVRVEVSFAEEIREILIVTSEGKMAEDQQPLLRFGVRAVVEAGGRRESGRSSGGGRVTLGYFEHMTPELHAQEAVRQALVQLDSVPAPAGKFEVVLAPGESGILLHEAVGHGLEADFNRKGTSNYTGRIGEMVASPLCTVVDDGSLLQGRGSINVDDEGEIPERSTLIEDGRLVQYMHDRLSARHYKLLPTGNGRRESFASMPLPRMTNTILLAGRSDPQEIIESVGKGIYARAFGGGQVDISNGDFVFNLTESYLIENGRITAPLKGTNLIGNGPETLSGVAMVGNDLLVSDGMWTCGKSGQSVPVGVGCPTLRLSQITVGGTSID